MRASKLGLVQCWRAARSVRKAEHGREVLRWMRPRTAMPIIRSRAPLTVLLYIAALEGCLLWQSADAFVVVERPGTHRRAPENAPRAARRLRALDHYWSVLTGVYLLGGLFLGTLMGLDPAVRLGWLSVETAFVVGIVTLAVAIPLLAISIVRFFRSELRTMMPRDPITYRTERAVGDTRFAHWSILLCHLDDADAVALLVDTLLSERDTGGRLLVFEQGITTAAARAAVRDSPYVRQRVANLDVLLMSAGEPWTMTLPPLPPRFWRIGRIFSLSYLAFPAAVAVVGGARVVADFEGAGCPAGACDDRPATYGRAVYWLINRLFGGDPEGIGAATLPGRAIGVLTTGVGVVLVGVLLGAVVTAITLRLTPPAAEPTDTRPEPPRADPDVSLRGTSAASRTADEVPGEQTDPRETPVRIGGTGAAVGVALMCGIAVGVYFARRRTRRS